MTPNVPTSDKGTAAAGMTVADRVRRNRKITMTTKATANIKLELHVSDRCADGGRAVRQHGRHGRTRASALCNCGSSLLMRSTTSMTLAPGWRWMLTITAGVSFIQAACFDVLDIVDHFGDIRQMRPARRCDRRRSAADIPCSKAADPLALMMEALPRSVERAFGLIDVGGGHDDRRSSSVSP